MRLTSERNCNQKTLYMPFENTLPIHKYGLDRPQNAGGGIIARGYHPGFISNDKAPSKPRQHVDLAQNHIANQVTQELQRVKPQMEFALPITVGGKKQSGRMVDYAASTREVRKDLRQDSTPLMQVRGPATLRTITQRAGGAVAEARSNEAESRIIQNVGLRPDRVQSQTDVALGRQEKSALLSQNILQNKCALLNTQPHQPSIHDSTKKNDTLALMPAATSAVPQTFLHGYNNVSGVGSTQGNQHATPFVLSNIDRPQNVQPITPSFTQMASRINPQDRVMSTRNVAPSVPIPHIPTLENISNTRTSTQTRTASMRNCAPANPTPHIPSFAQAGAITHQQLQESFASVKQPNVLTAHTPAAPSLLLASNRKTLQETFQGTHKPPPSNIIRTPYGGAEVVGSSKVVHEFEQLMKTNVPPSHILRAPQPEIVGNNRTIHEYESLNNRPNPNTASFLPNLPEFTPVGNNRTVQTFEALAAQNPLAQMMMPRIHIAAETSAGVSHSLPQEIGTTQIDPHYVDRQIGNAGQMVEVMTTHASVDSTFIDPRYPTMVDMIPNTNTNKVGDEVTREMGDVLPGVAQNVQLLPPPTENTTGNLLSAAAATGETTRDSLQEMQAAVWVQGPFTRHASAATTSLSMQDGQPVSGEIWNARASSLLKTPTSAPSMLPMAITT